MAEEGLSELYLMNVHARVNNYIKSMDDNTPEDIQVNISEAVSASTKEIDALLRSGGDLDLHKWYKSFVPHLSDETKKAIGID